MSKDRKMTTFRYHEEELKPYLLQLYDLQGGTTKTNEALNDAVIIAGSIIKRVAEDIEAGKIKGAHKYDTKRSIIRQELKRLAGLDPNKWQW